MSKEFDLHNSDYKGLIEDFKVAISTNRIKEILSRYYNKYKIDNPDFMQTLLENIESMYPEVFKKFTDWHNLKEEYEKEELFSEAKVKRKNAQIIYLYSYIIYLEENNIVLRDIARVQAAIKPSISEKNNFRTVLDAESLKSLHSWLIKEEYIEEIDFNSFKQHFSGNVFLKDKPEKIKWIKKYCGNTDNVGLFVLLIKICPEEFTDLKNIEYYDKITRHFMSDKKELSSKNMKGSLHRSLDKRVSPANIDEFIKKSHRDLRDLLNDLIFQSQ